MAEEINKKPLKASQLQKCDTTENWNKADNFIPAKGQIIIYQDFIGDTPLPTKHKVGNGRTKLAQLPFASNGETLGEGSQELSLNATALGKQTIAGSRGFRYTKREGFTDGRTIKFKTRYEGDMVEYTYETTGEDGNPVQLNSASQPWVMKKDDTCFADITQINCTSPGLAYTMLSDKGLVYRHIATGGSEVTTTIALTDVPICLPIFIKYRVNQGNSAQYPVGTAITYKDLTNKLHSLVNGMVHQSAFFGIEADWRVDRINLYSSTTPWPSLLDSDKSNGNCGKRGETTDIIIQIKHRDDLDIAYVLGDRYELNHNVLPLIFNGDTNYLQTGASKSLGNRSGDTPWRVLEKDKNGVVGVNTKLNTATRTTTLIGGSALNYDYYQAFYIAKPADEVITALKKKPNCSIATYNEYPIIPVVGVDVVSIDKIEYVRLLFNNEDFKKYRPTIKDPTTEEVAQDPRKQTIRIEGYPHYGDVEIGVEAFASGLESEALGYISRAGGRGTRALGAYSTTEGRGTVAAYAAHGEGLNTEATGEASHSEGYDTHAINTYTHTEGTDTIASGYASHAGGVGTRAKKYAQTTIGRYNADDGEAFLIVGAGENDSNRANALSAGKDSSGNYYLQINKTRITESQLIALLELLATASEEVYI